MKTYHYILITLLFPAALHAQDTALLKKQADAIILATKKGDYKTVVDHTYPKVVQMAGGKQAMLKHIVSGMDEMKKQGVLGVDGRLGPAGKFYKAGTEIHCLIPDTITLIKSNGRMVSTSYLLAVSGNKGQTWSFIDVGSVPTSMLRDMLLHFNKNLKIPDSTKPVFYPNK